MAEGYVKFCHHGLRDVSPYASDEEINDIEYMHAMYHAAQIGPFELCIDAFEIVAKEHPDSKAYEQILFGPFVELIDSLSEYDRDTIAPLIDKIVASPELCILVEEATSRYVSDEAQLLFFMNFVVGLPKDKPRLPL